MRRALCNLSTLCAAAWVARVISATIALVLWATVAEAQQPDSARAPAGDEAGSLMSDADRALQAGDTAQARLVYERITREFPDQSRAWYQLATLAAEPAPRVRLLLRYVTLEPDDAWGWLALGHAQRDAGDVSAAAGSYERAAQLAPADPEITAARRSLAPTTHWALHPFVHGSGDSDGSDQRTYGGSATAERGPVQFGLEGASLHLSDAEGTQLSGLQAAASVRYRRGAAQAVATIGVLQVGDSSLTEPIGTVRVRWRPPEGVAAEVRLRREPLTATPALLAAPVVLTEARAVLELPVLGPLYLRGAARHGQLADPADTNARTSLSAGPVVRVTPLLEVSVMAVRGGYARTATAAYFAPERVDAIDAGVYWENSGDGSLVLAVDAGGGMERVARFGERAGEWGPAFRLWSRATWWLRRGAGLQVDVEAYDTRAGDAVAATSDGWRWLSVTAGLLLRP